MIYKINPSKFVGTPSSPVASGITLPKYFRISFEIYFDTQVTDRWRNIFRLSDGTDLGNCGSRVPACFIKYGATTTFPIYCSMCVNTANPWYVHYTFNPR